MIRLTLSFARTPASENPMQKIGKILDFCFNIHPYLSSISPWMAKSKSEIRVGMSACYRGTDEF